MIIRICLFFGLLNPTAATAAQMSLQDMIRQFLQSSPNIQAAQARKEAAQEQAKISFSTFFPTLDLAASKREQKFADNPDLFGSSLGGALAGGSLSSTTYSVGLEANLPLYVGGARYNSYKLKRIEAEAAQADYVAIKNRSLGAVVGAVLGWLAARDQKWVLLQSQKIQKEYVGITRRRQKRGASLAFELSQAQADYASYGPRIGGLQQEMLAKEKELQAALGLDQPPEIKLNWPKPVKDLPNGPVESLRIAQKTRPDLISSKLQKIAAEKNKSLSLSEDLPTLALAGTYTYQDTDTQDIFNDENASQSISINLRIPLFSGLSSVHKRKAGEHNVYAAEKNLRIKSLEVESEVNTSYSAVNTTFDQLKQTGEWQLKAREAMNLGNKSYRVGRLSSVQWVQLQKGKEAAELSYTQAQLRHHLAVLQWSLAMGVDLGSFYMAQTR